MRVAGNTSLVLAWSRYSLRARGSARRHSFPKGGGGPHPASRPASGVPAKASPSSPPDAGQFNRRSGRRVFRPAMRPVACSGRLGGGVGFLSRRCLVPVSAATRRTRAIFGFVLSLGFPANPTGRRRHLGARLFHTSPAVLGSLRMRFPRLAGRARHQRAKSDGRAFKGGSQAVVLRDGMEKGFRVPLGTRCEIRWDNPSQTIFDFDDDRRHRKLRI
jgi:hypothetical protein